LGLTLANLGVIANYISQYQQKRESVLASQTAQKRYENGCIYVKSIASGKPASLIPNTPVINKNTAGFFPVGTVVCDIYGNTAKIKNKKLEYKYTSPNGRFEYSKGEVIPVISKESLAYTGKPPNKEIPGDAPIGYIGRVTNIQR
jgi:hypothetical protein